MPINPIVLQQRHAELGRIRLGNKVGDGRGRPNKLDRFRFTSVSERYIKDLAQLYGGEAKTWDNGGIPSWEVLSEAQTIPVIAVKGGLSQWLEHWTGGGCARRCTGEREQITDSPCICDAQGGDRLCKPTTRLSVMIPELDAVGVFRLESHGWNAAAEIPAVAELATFVGDLVPAHLNLVERRAVKDGKTSRFVVPVLDLQIGTARLRQIVEAKVSGGALAPAAAAQIEGPTGQLPAGGDPFASYVVRVDAASSKDDLSSVWADALAAGLVGTASQRTGWRDAFYERFQAKSQSLAPVQVPDADGAVDAELVEDDPPGAADAVWQQVLAAGGAAGMSLADVDDEYSRWSDGLRSGDATVAQLTGFLAYVQRDAQVPA